MSSEVHDLSVRELRAQLGPMLDRVEEGAHVVIRRNGRVVARIVPERLGDEVASGNPLKGSVVAMADDFDDPLDDQWEALLK